jgi:hypothetical protein
VPKTVNPEKAQLIEIEFREGHKAKEVSPSYKVNVQFNPETLKVNLTNQKAGGDQGGGSGVQYIASSATKLSMELWFDVTKQKDGDVRVLTQKVAYFMKPKKSKKDEKKLVPPGVRFVWGSFLFDGVMDSIDENLEFFSDMGKPLRARLSINMSRQEFQYHIEETGVPAAGGGAQGAGTVPRQPVVQGDTMQQVAARAGRQKDWKRIAAANNIENPRRLEPGTMLNLNPRRDGGA